MSHCCVRGLGALPVISTKVRGWNGGTVDRRMGHMSHISHTSFLSGQQRKFVLGLMMKLAKCQFIRVLNRLWFSGSGLRLYQKMAEMQLGAASRR